MKKAFILVFILTAVLNNYALEITLSTGDVIQSNVHGFDYYGEYYEVSSAYEITTPAGRFKVDYRIYLSESGSIIGCYPAEKYTVETPAGKIEPSILFFYESGAISECHTESPVTASTPAGDMTVRGITFYENGSIRQCEIDYETGFMIETKAGSFSIFYISFYESGAVLDCGISYIDDYKLKTAYGSFLVSYISFYESGELHECELRENVKIDGEYYYEYTGLVFSESGELIDTYFSGGA
jgi:hypothetical protein